MSALDRKLGRDLWHLKGQILAIALVIACGVATYVMFLSTLESLKATRANFYQAYRFAQVFASLKRAPDSLAARLAAIPGVALVDTRVVAPTTIDIPQFRGPITGLITSVPDAGEPPLNRLDIKSGHGLDAGRNDEVLVSEAFAQAHRLRPGDMLAVIVHGRRKILRIAGTAISPEFIHQLRPGGVFPDYQRYGVMWMARTPLAKAMDLDGAFNNAVFKLARGADARDVITRLDALLAPYGGTGAYARKDQSSHRFFSEELTQLENNSALFPFIFLGVASFLLNVVITRLVGTQRDQIATLKAFGYANRAIAWHYVKMVMVIVLLGVALGTAGGIWLTRIMGHLYMGFFRLPYIDYVFSPRVLVSAALISAAAGLLGTMFAVARAARLRPAEAMRAEAPSAYRETALERLGLKGAISMPTRMIVRHLEHRPLKSLLAVIGIAFAGALTMTGRFQHDTVNFMMHVHYGLTQRDDLTVTFVEPTARRALHDLLGIPGITYGEPFRSVPVRLRHDHFSDRTGILGLSRPAHLMRVLDHRFEPVALPREGLVLTDYLGKLLHVRPGDLVTVETLDGSRKVRRVPVTALVKQYIGVSGYMDLDALNRLLGEGPVVSGAYLRIDPRQLGAIEQRLKGMPRIAGISVRASELENFRRIMQETMLFWSGIATVFASIIAFGVIYNAARIALTEHGRELASLRVLGFTRGEISYILLGELGLLTLAAIVPGMFIGRWLCGSIAASVESDLYRIPLIVQPDSYAFSATVVFISAIVSAWLVRRRLDRLDLIAVLKTRE